MLNCIVPANDVLKIAKKYSISYFIITTKSASASNIKSNPPEIKVSKTATNDS